MSVSSCICGMFVSCVHDLQFVNAGCCLSSETYGRNGVTPSFRSFHRTASSTTGGWSRNIF